MDSKEWLKVMQQAADYNPNITPLIEKYGELLLEEYKLLNNNSDAVEFCEWASLVYYEGIGEQKGFWFDDRGECVATSTSELYKIFKSLPSPPIQQPKI